MNWHDIIERAAWTAAEAFCATFVIYLGKGAAVDWDTALVASAVAALAAVLSFVKNVAKQKIQAR